MHSWCSVVWATMCFVPAGQMRHRSTPHPCTRGSPSFHHHGPPGPRQPGAGQGGAPPASPCPERPRARPAGAAFGPCALGSAAAPAGGPSGAWSLSEETNLILPAPLLRLSGDTSRLDTPPLSCCQTLATPPSPPSARGSPRLPWICEPHSGREPAQVRDITPAPDHCLPTVPTRTRPPCVMLTKSAVFLCVTHPCVRALDRGAPGARSKWRGGHCLWQRDWPSLYTVSQSGQKATARLRPAWGQGNGNPGRGGAVGLPW